MHAGPGHGLVGRALLAVPGCSPAVNVLASSVCPSVTSASRAPGRAPAQHKYCVVEVTNRSIDGASAASAAAVGCGWAAPDLSACGPNTGLLQHLTHATIAHYGLSQVFYMLLGLVRSAWGLGPHRGAGVLQHFGSNVPRGIPPLPLHPAANKRSFVSPGARAGRGTPHTI
jgi:hypothetical protein